MMEPESGVTRLGQRWKGAAGHLSLGAARGGGGRAAHGAAHREREKRR
ncbi:MAG: hypothetical protein V8S34_00965 [Lawsonibacter sp.]